MIYQVNKRPSISQNIILSSLTESATTTLIEFTGISSTKQIIRQIGRRPYVGKIHIESGNIQSAGVPTNLRSLP